MAEKPILNPSRYTNKPIYAKLKKTTTKKPKQSIADDTRQVLIKISLIYA
jgi:hypothetical protein